MAAVVWIAALALVLSWAEARAHAQRSTEAELVHAYARVMVGEAGWENAREHAALAWTLRRRAEHLRRTRGWTELTTIQRYATGNVLHAHTERQRWIVALPRDGVTCPAAWPSGALWADYAVAWRAALSRARDFVHRGLADPCDGPSEHWGSRRHHVDVARARRAVRAGRWQRVDCSGGGEPTRNAFFALALTDGSPARGNGPRSAGSAGTSAGGGT